jgi:hypothetical protein
MCLVEQTFPKVTVLIGNLENLFFIAVEWYCSISSES